MMKPALCLLILNLWLVACAASASPPAADSDARHLATLMERATELARQAAAEVILRQVDSDLKSVAFRFTDGAATQEILVVIPGWPDAPEDQWTVRGGLLSPLVGHVGPALDLADISVGPEQVAEAVAAQWPGCSLRGMTLHRNQQESGASWTAFCNTAEGVVSGSMDAQDGSFVPSSAPPAWPPVTATPAP